MSGKHFLFLSEINHLPKNMINECPCHIECFLFVHNDFHAGNIIVNNGKYAGVIDFIRCGLNDPYHEFNDGDS